MLAAHSVLFAAAEGRAVFITLLWWVRCNECNKKDQADSSIGSCDYPSHSSCRPIAHYSWFSKKKLTGGQWSKWGRAQSKAHVICIITCSGQVSQLLKNFEKLLIIANKTDGPYDLIVCTSACFKQVALLIGLYQTSKWELSEQLKTDWEVLTNKTTATGYKWRDN